jgi:hypothetical protein
MCQMTSWIVRIVAALGLFGLAGCTESTSAVSKSGSTAPASPSVASTAVESSPPAAVRETWDVYVMQGKRIGYGHTTVREEVEAGQKVLYIESIKHLAVKREGQTTEEDIQSSSVETPDGKLLRFACEMRMGGSPVRTTGRVSDGQLVFDTVAAGANRPVRTSIPWDPDCLGPFATDQTLLRRPMQPGERRTLKTLMIGLNQLAEVDMVAKTFEPTAMLTGTHELLHIETVARLAGGQKIDGSVWTDRTGETLKTSQAMGLMTFRTSKSQALEKADVAELDLLAGTLVKVDRPLPEGHRTREACYRVHLDRSDPAGAFVAGPSQKIRPIDAHTAEITVYAVRPVQAGGNSSAPPDPPSEDDRRPNNFIQSDDPVIVADAKKAAGTETDPWRVAVALERFVNREVKNKSYSRAFASAAEVAQSREGDCTEHAVFLAALSRACGIPARVAIGLVYLEGQQAFGYHAWTEVYVDGRWIPIDGTLARGGIGAGHLKIAHSNLKGGSPWDAFLPVVQILGQLQISVVSAR